MWPWEYERSELNGERYLSCGRADLGIGTGELLTGARGVALGEATAMAVRGMGEGNVEEGRGKGRWRNWSPLGERGVGT